MEESGEGLPLGFDSGQRFAPSPTGASSVSASGLTSILVVYITDLEVFIHLLNPHLITVPGGVCIHLLI